MTSAQNVVLFVDTTSLYKGDTSPIWGRVHLLVNGVAFPDAGWTDIAVGLAACWVQAVYRLSAGNTDQELVHFFDGPFAVRLKMNDTGGVQVDCVDGHEPETIVRSATTSITDLVRNAESMGRDVIDAAEANKWAFDFDVKCLVGEILGRY